MRPDQIENKRYENNYFCEIRLEERIMFKLLKNWTKDKGRSVSDVKVLDLGCGSGLITKKIKNAGYQVKGLDFSQEALKKAREAGVEVELCNLEEPLGELEGSYDVVWAGDIVEHVFDPIGLLKEARRVLKKDGILILSIPSNVGLGTRLLTLFGDSYQSTMYKKSGYYKHHTFFTLDLIRFMLKKSNLDPDTIHKILNLGGKRISHPLLPSFLYDQLVIRAKK